ncbi:MAG: zf-TFIIB domain-containing protein [Oscillospiraceae bacterium]|nr:zf-TFIIB domain-containing protein [Oscillospiraceae bacterium]
MKCPRCGSEMVIDSHRKIPLNMCYNCGYIEGRTTDDTQMGATNYDHLQDLNLNETAAFIAEGLKKKGVSIEEELISGWLMETHF